MNKFLLIVTAALCLMGLVAGEVFFEQKFGEDWEETWTAGEKSAELELTEEGVKTSTDAKFYHYTAPIKTFSNKDKTLVFQFEVRHPQDIDCGGGYLKLLPEGFDAENFNGDSPYLIMFGPDICGSSRRTHVIFNYKDDNKLIKKDISCEGNIFSHVYTLIVEPDQTFRVLIDNEEKRSGNLVDEFDFLAPKQIKDPEASKPADWVDEAKIADPEDKKPEGYDDIEAQIVDPDATKPDDWDDDLDGEWEAPMIDNPEYKGEWKPKMIDNPEYKGEWEHPLVDNPDYAHDDSIYAFDNIGGLAIDLWQVKSGTIFNNILITDDEELAKERAEETVERRKQQEEEQKEKDDQERMEREAEAKKREAEEASKPVDAADDEDNSADETDNDEGHDEL